MLDAIDAAAKERGLTRSAFLASAARKEMKPRSAYFFAQSTLKRALRQVSPLSLKFAASTGS